MARATVIKWGGYRGVLAAEYEIRDNADVLVATDTVVIHPRAGETRAMLLNVVEAFLRRRCYKIALSDTPEKMQRRREVATGDALVTRRAEAAPINMAGARAVNVTVTAAEALLAQDEREVDEFAFDPQTGLYVPTGGKVMSRRFTV